MAAAFEMEDGRMGAVHAAPGLALRLILRTLKDGIQAVVAVGVNALEVFAGNIPLAGTVTVRLQQHPGKTGVMASGVCAGQSKLLHLLMAAEPSRTQTPQVLLRGLGRVHLQLQHLVKPAPHVGHRILFSHGKRAVNQRHGRAGIFRAQMPGFFKQAARLFRLVVEYSEAIITHGVSVASAARLPGLGETVLALDPFLHPRFGTFSLRDLLCHAVVQGLEKHPHMAAF